MDRETLKFRAGLVVVYALSLAIGWAIGDLIRYVLR